MKPQSAANRAGPGDFIYLRGGVYDQRHASRSRGYNGLLNLYGGSDGHPGAVITLKSYPGERAIFQGGELENTGIWLNRSYWRIEGLKIESGNIGVARPFLGGVHHVWIVNNEVSDVVARLGNNGLIKVDGNTAGGADPSDIYIWNNDIHDLWGVYRADKLRQVRARRGLPAEAPGQRPVRKTQETDSQDSRRGGEAPQSDRVKVPWNEDIDLEHHACILVMRGSGQIEIKGNEAYRCASITYFKYDWDGPIVVEGNRFHDAQQLGEWRNANNQFRNNMVYNIESGLRLRSQSLSHTFERNTFVGLSNVLSMESSDLPTESPRGGHTLRDNVVFGSGFLAGGTTPDGEILVGESDGNCFITAPNFVALGKGKKGLGLSGYNLKYGLDQSSVRFTSTNPVAVFANPASGDYSLIGEAAERCPSDGADLSGSSHTSSH